MRNAARQTACPWLPPPRDVSLDGDTEFLDTAFWPAA